jgi:hypothetical protein
MPRSPVADYNVAPRHLLVEQNGWQDGKSSQEAFLMGKAWLHASAQAMGLAKLLVITSDFEG